MLNDKQIQRMLRKLKRFEDTLDGMIFEKVCDLPVSAYETKESLYQIPDSSLFEPIHPGDIWGGEGVYCWFKSSYTRQALRHLCHQNRPDRPRQPLLRYVREIPQSRPGSEPGCGILRRALHYRLHAL